VPHVVEIAPGAPCDLDYSTEEITFGRRCGRRRTLGDIHAVKSGSAALSEWGPAARAMRDELRSMDALIPVPFLLRCLVNEGPTAASAGYQDIPMYWKRQTDESIAKAQKFLQELACELRGQSRAKGQPGRRGYPIEAWKHARRLRRQHPGWKAGKIRSQCLKQFHPDDLPHSSEGFRRWLNRSRKNRAN